MRAICIYFAIFNKILHVGVVPVPKLNEPKKVTGKIADKPYHLK
jgi:hypothetical protein